MFGTLRFKWVHGKWDHVGWLKTDNLPVSLSTVNNAITGKPMIPRGTYLDYSTTDDNEAVLASGNYCGMMTQDIDSEGTTGLGGFKAFSIGQFDLPVKVGRPVSLRQPAPGSIVEFEGGGNSGPGNLVCTSGTGAIASGDSRGTQLSCFNGSIRQAQTGDLVIGTLELTSAASQMPLLDSANGTTLRIRVKMSAPTKKV